MTTHAITNEASAAPTVADALEGAGFVWASLYTVTRHCGGSEEGGWWHNRRELYASVRVPDTEEQREAIRAYFGRVVEREGLKWGNIYHSTGGQDATVFFEEDPGAFETLDTPQYS